MKRLAFMLLILGGITSLPAQENGIDQDLELVTYPTGEHVIVWYGYVGRSYFLQVSDPVDHLNKWHWANIIEGGEDQDISHEVGGTGDKGFFRLKYTDQVPGPSETLDTADFDGDGISNWDEINTYQTDPLNPDTDRDGIPDGWGSPTDSIPLTALTPPRSFPAAISPTSKHSKPECRRIQTRLPPTRTATASQTQMMPILMTQPLTGSAPPSLTMYSTKSKDTTCKLTALPS
ncbi:MAG: hypothetical protein DVB26_02425 [Verrucomicrobia bacterium]|nr:MAG: hypothetical protein DVB26_02425 [Verrucomicrobiota bacterium]